MAEIYEAAKVVYADGPALTPSEPPKADIRDVLFKLIDNKVTDLESLVAIGAKAPVAVRALATTNINLANGIENGDSFAGVTLVTGDIVVLTGQTDATQNGPYTAVASGAASRTTGFTTGANLLKATFYVVGGTYAGQVWAVRNDAITVGSTSISITYAYLFASLPDGAVTTAKLGDESVTFAKMQDIAESALLGRYSEGTGVVQSVGVGGGLEFFSGYIRIGVDAVPNIKLADMAEGTVKMRRAGTGTGDPTDTTLANLKTDMVFVKADVGLGNVDNTADVDKPVSTPARSVFDAIIASITRREWVPELLFVGGEKGFYFDALADGTLWTDTAAATPSTVDGQIVKRINASYPGGGAGGNFLQSVTGNAPVLDIDTVLGRRAVRFDAVDNIMSAAGVDFDGCTKVTMVVAVNQTNGNNSGIIFDHGTGITGGSGGFAALINNGTARSPGGGMGAAGNYQFNNGFATAAPRSYVLSIILDPAGATSDDRIRMRVDGVEIDEILAASAGTVVAASAFDLRTMFLGGRSGGTLYAGIDVASAIVIGRELTADEIDAAERWAGYRLAPNFPFAHRPTAFSDSHTPVDDAISIEPSPFATAEYDTTANTLYVEGISYLVGSHPYLSKLGVYVDGEHHSSLTFAGLLGQHVVALPGGRKTVAIVAGPTTGTSEAFSVGTSVLKVRADAELTQVNLGLDSDIVVYGDSIAVGDACVVDVMLNAWPLQVRRAAMAAGLRLAVEGRGIRSLHEDAVDSTARAAFVAKIVAYNPSIIWMAIGTNDWGLNKWSAADFGTAYAALLDDLHTALPSADIYCQTPLTRGGEASANGSGSTLPDYRTQIATAVSTRTAYATLVLGPSILSYPSDFYDATHPSDAGSTVYANFVKTELGL